MSTDIPTLKAHRAPLAGFERSIERTLGVDMRLLYGMGVPVIGMSVLIAVLLAVSPSPWIVGLLLVLEAGALGVVLLGLMSMMSEDDDDESL